MNHDPRPPTPTPAPFNTRAELLEAFGCALLGCLFFALLWVVL